MAVVKLEPIIMREMQIRIVGISSMIQHNWAEKSREMLRLKHSGKKTKVRAVRDPEAESLAAAHRTEDGRYGVPAGAIKQCLVGAAHKDVGIEKTLLRKHLFIVGDAISEDKQTELCLLEGDPPVMREDMVRVGQGSADLRYRPEFRNWAITLTVQFEATGLREQDIINLLQHAGFGVGLLEWRPEKNGDHGRFTIDPNFEVSTVDMVAG